MKSALLREYDGPLTIEDVEPNGIQADEVLVRIVGVGLCHTDLTAIKGDVPLPLPAVIGHEGAGVIEAVGDEVTTLAVGDHVVLSFDSCRECAACKSGHPAYCQLFAAMNYFGTRLDGSPTLQQGSDDVHGSWFGQSSFGTHAVASARNAVKVDKDLPLELLGPLGCGLLTGAGAVLNVLRPQPGQSIGVWGLGTVGLAAVMAAKAAGCETIVAVDMNFDRLAIAKELGATHVFDPTEHTDLVWEISEQVGGLDYTVEAVGLGSVIRQALETLRSPGTCATLGLQTLENEITVDQGHLLIGRTLTGVIEGDADPHTFIPELIELWRAGKFPFDKLIQTFPLNKINDAIDSFRSGLVVKPVLLTVEETK
ncbi:NAD(P)-dependent alcohol dehydrogenase [Antrihabitans stalactiti]|uniref:NAD(P)-dependent alcohol dehydrogenase n=1 Tax=Antrihabitans stalactiti TaxID=2584121 RepID=A0A848KQ28_9NOCA|nr:NAD(P)-dependent alcohol dehydrogenase [Antrihabitans stalactiti]NMN98390.1 NAD(P)-dependent alcohol dehydrogenase [Antrihabitans stalactiti]